MLELIRIFLLILAGIIVVSNIVVVASGTEPDSGHWNGLNLAGILCVLLAMALR